MPRCKEAVISQDLLDVSNLAEPLQAWVSQEIDAVLDYAAESGVSFSDAITRIEKNLRHCKAKSADAFALWACRQISQCQGFTGSMRAIRKLDLDVLNFLSGMRRSDTPAPFESLPDGDSILVNMGVHDGTPRAWRVPKNKTVTFSGKEYSWAEAVESLWPCFLENDRVMTKIKGQNIHVARILLGARDDEQIRFANGNKLDYSADNPFIVSDKSRTLQKRFDDNVMRYGTNSNVEWAPHDRSEMLAKPTAPKQPLRDESIDNLRSGDFRASKARIVDAGPTPSDNPSQPDLWGYEPESKTTQPSEPTKKRKGSVTRLYCVHCAALVDIRKVENGVYTLYCGHTRAK